MIINNNIKDKNTNNKKCQIIKINITTITRQIKDLRNKMILTEKNIYLLTGVQILMNEHNTKIKNIIREIFLYKIMD